MDKINEFVRSDSFFKLFCSFKEKDGLGLVYLTVDLRFDELQYKEKFTVKPHYIKTSTPLFESLHNHILRTKNFDLRKHILDDKIAVLLKFEDTKIWIGL